jgi:hypothetical protein
MAKRYFSLALLLPFLLVPALNSGATAASGLPAVRHVFVIVLENSGYSTTFGNPTADPYLAQILPAAGALLRQYYGIGHASNDNYIAMVSGQAPNPQNQGDCQVFSDFTGSGPVVSPGQAAGSGCVFPTTVQTIGNQLAARSLSWKAYLGDMGNDPSREPAVCAHPAINSQDHTQSAEAGDGYATRHNPWVYFHGVIDNQATCDRRVVPLGTTSGSLPPAAPAGTTGLATDLRSATTTPSLSFIVPNLCDDGHDFPCTNQPSGASALADMDAFLQTWVPLITKSPAYHHGGLLAIIFDEAGTSDTTACCNEQPGPNSPMPGITGMGGGRTGAVLLSPFIRPGTVTDTGYNHYSLLASLESLFGLKRLGEAATVPATLGRDVFTGTSSGMTPASP